jgi:exopolyphosphatase/guanosine-5'-triphosphate,3'-diphosphate pyrophosphatase
VATAAVREAADGPEFQDLVEAETGLRLHVIDGEEEARLSAQGVLLGWPEAEGLVCDIGGNSMELAEVSGGDIGRRVTSPLGPFRLREVSGGQKLLDTHIKKIVDALKTNIGRHHDRIYLVGGSWRAFARIDMERRAYPLTVLHEYRMTPTDVQATADFIERHTTAELRAMTGIGQERMDLIHLAARVLSRLARTFDPREIDVSSYGIREGLLYEQMPKKLRRRDPLIEACRYAEKTMARMPGFGKKLYDFLNPIFVDAPPGLDRLIRAACYLHDTTWRAHPDYRAEACFDNATRGNLGGISHPERVLLGLALLHRYKNSREGSRLAPLFKLLDEKQIQWAEVLGKAMRFGAMFAVRDPQAAGSLAWDEKDRILRLSLTEEGEGLFGEVARARFQSLAASLKADVRVEIAEQA